MKGITFTLCIGKFGGFNIRIKNCFRLCLGWISFTIYFYDREILVQTSIEKLMSEVDNLKNKEL
jgi:hypothetical protein